MHYFQGLREHNPPPLLGASVISRLGLLLCVLCPGTPEGSTDSGSGLKRLSRWGHSLKSPTDWWNRGSRLIRCNLKVLYVLRSYSTPNNLRWSDKMS